MKPPLILLLTLLLTALTACTDPPEAVAPDAGTSEPDADLDDAPDPEPGPPEPVEPRAQGTRAPMSAPCDPADPMRCLLPWPSDTFTRTDPDTATGLRLDVGSESLPDHDDPTSMNRADGHSRVSPLVTAFEGGIDEASVGEGIDEGALRVFVSEPGEGLGQSVPLRYEVVQDNEQGESWIVGYPRRPMSPDAEHVAVVLDTLRNDEGQTPERDRHSALALGFAEPEDDDEAALFAYHAPSRLALAEAGVELESVVRLWSFTTRSKRDPLTDLEGARELMLEALEAGQVEIVFDEITPNPSPTTAFIALGRLVGLPVIVGETGGLFRNEEGQLEGRGTREAPFRAVIPRTEGDYRVVMYGHGTGGDVRDSTFDATITGEGAAKVGIQFDAWTERGLLASAGDFLSGVSGSERTAARLVESIAMGMAIQRSLAGPLGDALSAPLLQGEPNPLVGRRPDLEGVVWAGGSLGGVTGAVYANADPEVQAAVLNVPGAGFTHFLRFSELYSVLNLLLEANYDTGLDISVAIAMAQVNLDHVDGAAWGDAAEARPALLLQQSIGDPVLPNIGSDLLATAVGALHVGAVISPVPGLEAADSAVGVSAFVQFKVPQDEGSLGIHGFAARDTPAGRAARAQIRAFILSHWLGQARIELPEECLMNTPAASCDFSEP